MLKEENKPLKSDLERTAWNSFLTWQRLLQDTVASMDGLSIVGENPENTAIQVLLGDQQLDLIAEADYHLSWQTREIINLQALAKQVGWTYKNGNELISEEPYEYIESPVVRDGKTIPYTIIIGLHPLKDHRFVICPNHTSPSSAG